MAYTDPQGDQYRIKTPSKTVMAEELEAEIASLERLASMQGAIIANIEDTLWRFKLVTDGEAAKYKGQPISYEDARQSYNGQYSRCVDARRELKRLNGEIERVKGRFRMIGEAADKVQTASRSVADTSGKNKLYIGNRHFVVDHTQSKPDRERTKKARILDSNSWTWGLNLAWVEGGIEAEAEFKIKTDAGNPWASLPEPVEDEMRWNARMTSDRWLELCEENKGAGNMLWVTGTGEDRPSWTALEIAACLAKGYRFEFRRRNSGAGEKIVLTR